MEILKFPYYEEYDALICDGAVRSGKTIWDIISFVIWSMSNFKEQNFAICGKTIASAVRNVVKPLMKVKYMRDNFTMHYNKLESLLVVTRGKKKNYYYVFGGKDESSFQLIQGITLAGIFCEAAIVSITVTMLLMFSAFNISLSSSILSFKLVEDLKRTSILSLSITCVRIPSESVYLAFKCLYMKFTIPLLKDCCIIDSIFE
jgi:hypothetical protein